MPTLKLFRSRRWAAACVGSACCLLFGATLRGDVIETADGETAAGTVRSVHDGVVTITPVGKPDAPRKFEFVNLLRVSVDPYIDRRQLASLLIDNDGAHVGRTLSKRVKLRTGLHRIVIPYLHDAGNAMLRLQYSG